MQRSQPAPTPRVEAPRITQTPPQAPPQLQRQTVAPRQATSPVPEVPRLQPSAPIVRHEPPGVRATPPAGILGQVAPGSRAAEQQREDARLMQRGSQGPAGSRITAPTPTTPRSPAPQETTRPFPSPGSTATAPGRAPEVIPPGRVQFPSGSFGDRLQSRFGPSTAPNGPAGLGSRLMERIPQATQDPTAQSAVERLRRLGLESLRPSAPGISNPPAIGSPRIQPGTGPSVAVQPGPRNVQPPTGAFAPQGAGPGSRGPDERMTISELRNRILGGSGGEGQPRVGMRDGQPLAGPMAPGRLDGASNHTASRLPLPDFARGPGMPQGKQHGGIGRDGPAWVGYHTEDLLNRDRPSRPRPGPEDRFQDRIRGGQMDQLTRGQTARRFNLDEQYRMHPQGDVARRMHFAEHMPKEDFRNPMGHPGGHGGGGHPYVGHHGPIGPHYMDACFRHSYYGPGYFPATTWYPHWADWVAWSWGYDCPLVWDPRPIWCRPIIYASCTDWAYYPVPVWEPLPTVVCGTWVDVPPVQVEEQSDLQLLAVRFVDPGHPEENLGPRYRVWFRNNGRLPVTRPFDVVLLASLDGQLVAGLPQAGVRVTAIEGGDTQAVDIRLPISVGSMGRDPQGQPLPFGFLHVLVDANRQIPEPSRDNNGASISRADVLPVDPATFEARPNQQTVQGEVILAGEGYGPGPGRVLLMVAGQELDAEILGWYDLGVRVRLPAVAIAAPATGDLVVIRGDGAASNPMRLTLQPGAAGPELLPPGVLQ